MKPQLSTKRNAAMTLFEVGIVMAILLILAVVILPYLAATKKKSSKVGCTNLLKQISLAYKIWEGDNSDRLPMRVSVANGGSMEMTAAGDAVATFMVMSNELSTPKILICPNDSRSTYAHDFSHLTNSNISYFVSMDVTNSTTPQMIISGDCNFELGGKPVKAGLNAFATNIPAAWSAARHVRAGNIGLNDGSVESTTSASLQNYLRQTASPPTASRFLKPASDVYGSSTKVSAAVTRAQSRLTG